MQERVLGFWRKLSAAQRFAVVVTAVYIVAQLVVLRFHEMWRDELQAWLIARAAHTPLDVFRNLRYEGHPALWHFLLYVLTRFSGNPILMQLLHVGIAAATIYLISCYAPLSRMQKILLAGGYLFFYEYGIIARNYQLGVFFLMLYCVLMTAQRRRYIWIGITLFLAANSNAMSAILAIPLAAYTFLDYWSVRRAGQQNDGWQPVLIGGAIAAVGVLVFYAQVRPPIDGMIGVTKIPDIRNSLATIWQAYAPIPASVANFWSTNFVPSLDYAVMLSVLLLMVGALFFSRRVRLLLLYLSGTFMLVAFFYLKALGSIRQQGFLFVWLVVCVWLLYAHQAQFSSKQKNAATGLRLYQQVVLYSLLLAQLIAGMRAVWKEYELPFSQAKATAAYIKQENLDALPVASYVDALSTSVLGYIDRPAYYPQSDATRYYAKWDARRVQPITLPQVVEKTKDFAARQHKDVLLILNAPIAPAADKTGDSKVQFIRGFVDSNVVVDENYYLYRVQP